MNTDEEAVMSSHDSDRDRIDDWEDRFDDARGAGQAAELDERALAQRDDPPEDPEDREVADHDDPFVPDDERPVVADDEPA